MIYRLHAFRRPVAEEVNRVVVEKFAISIAVNNIGAGLAQWLQGTVVDGRIHLHAPSVYHRAEQGILFNLVVQQHRHCHHLQSRHRQQRHIPAIADTLSHRNTDAQARVRTGTLTHRHSTKWNGVVVGERQRLVNENTQAHGMVRTAMILLLEDALTVLAHRYRTYIGARLYA